MANCRMDFYLICCINFEISGYLCRFCGTYFLYDMALHKLDDYLVRCENRFLSSIPTGHFSQERGFQIEQSPSGATRPCYYVPYRNKFLSQ